MPRRCWRRAALICPYATVNPLLLRPGDRPHLAAAEECTTVSPGPINAAFAKLCGASDFVVVEGAGGWRVPSGPDLDIQRLALALGLPVILVVGLRLGCLNHAVLSEQAIKASGACCFGWVGSQVDPECPVCGKTSPPSNPFCLSPAWGYCPTLMPPAQSIAPPPSRSTPSWGCNWHVQP